MTPPHLRLGNDFVCKPPSILLRLWKNLKILAYHLYGSKSRESSNEPESPFTRSSTPVDKLKQFFTNDHSNHA